VEGPVKHVGRNLRGLREAAGLSSAELARRSGVARATLTQLEAGGGNPTLETLYALANELGVTLSDIIAPPATPEVRVVRSGEGPRVRGAAVDSRLLTRFQAGGLVGELYWLRLVPGARQESAPHPAGVVEHLLLHSGRALVGPASTPVELGPGDYVSYDAAQPHVYEGDAEGALLILSPLRGA
jgi:transcriptional regulator with XRE-family HTH domain